MNTRKQLRKLLNEEGLIKAVGCYDVLSAKQIERAGFPAIYLGSYAASATLLGKPDIGLLTRSEFVSLASRVVQEVNIPVIADAENGYGDLIATRRTVEDFENAGVAALQIEDGVFGKHFDPEHGIVISIEDMVEKIKTACDARKDPDTVIIGRTELWVYKDIDIAIERSCLMAEAGADMVYIAGLSDSTEEDIRRVVKDTPVPQIFGYRNANYNHAQLEKMGLKTVVHWSETLLVANNAVKQFLAGLAKNGTSRGLVNGSMHELERELGIENWIEYYNKFKKK